MRRRCKYVVLALVLRTCTTAVPLHHETISEHHGRIRYKFASGKSLKSKINLHITQLIILFRFQRRRGMGTAKLKNEKRHNVFAHWASILPQPLIVLSCSSLGQLESFSENKHVSYTCRKIIGHFLSFNGFLVYRISKAPRLLFCASDELIAGFTVAVVAPFLLVKKRIPRLKMGARPAKILKPYSNGNFRGFQIIWNPAFRLDARFRFLTRSSVPK